MLHKRYSKVLTSKPCVLTTYLNLETLHLLQVYLGAWAKIEIVIENNVCWIFGYCYYSIISYNG